MTANVMNSAEERLATVASRLRSKPWFKKNEWIISTHPFPAKSPEAVTFHAFKKHWFNEDHHGIHVESYLMLDPRKQKKSYVTVHLLHEDFIRGNKISRKVLAKEFVDSIFDQVSDWDGYKFRAGKYGVQPFTKLLDGSAKDFEKTLELEVTRICTKLGPYIDDAIRSTTKQRGGQK